MAKCEWCLTPAKHKELECDNCGGSVNLEKPWVLLCGWCGSSNRRDEHIECRNCEGELPQIPGTHRPPKPTPVPRTITKAYRKRVWFTKNVSMVIGVVFCFFGTPCILSAIFSLPIFVTLFLSIFLISGIWQLRVGYKKAKRKLTALEFGAPVEGTITNVGYDNSQTINGKHPILIQYTFKVNGKEYEDKTEVWDRVNLKRLPGEELWVVCDKNNITNNNIWPPLK